MPDSRRNSRLEYLGLFCSGSWMYLYARSLCSKVVPVSVMIHRTAVLKLGDLCQSHFTHCGVACILENVVLYLQARVPALESL